MNNQRKHIQVFDHFWNKTEYTTWNMFFPWFEKGQLLQKIKKTSLLIYCLHDIILRNCSYPRQQAYYLILLMLWPEHIYAPINVKPAAGGGGGKATQGMGWGFDIFQICRKIPCQRANHSSWMQPNFPTPGCTLLSNIPRQNPRKAQWKYLQIKLCNLYL